LSLSAAAAAGLGCSAEESAVMTNPNEELAGRIRSGTLMGFLRRDLFLVQFDDGITITAVMPEQFFEWYNPNVHYTRVNRPSVEVEMRDAQRGWAGLFGLREVDGWTG
jgi:hypothetical protein